MSPNQGGRKSSDGRGRSASGPVAARRRGLVLFGAVFIVLFAIVAISEGLGEPSVPSGDVILVEDAIGDSGEISKADFDHAVEAAAGQAGVTKIPKPGEGKYDELKEAALSALIEFAWLEGQATEMGITVSDKEVAKELKKIKDESFQSEAEFQSFVKKANFTDEDVDTRVKLQIINTKIQEYLQAEPPAPSQGEIEEYYEAAKSTQYVQTASRDIRFVQNKDRAKVTKALQQLETDNTAKSWKEVARKYSENQSTKNKGGLQLNVTVGSYEEPLYKAIFDAPEGEIQGPVKNAQGYYGFEVLRSHPESTQPLKKVESQIESQLIQRGEQEELNALAADFNSKWRSRTFCADDYVTESCENFTGNSHPPTAPAGCYEEDPDGGRPEACPAPVFQLIPALPGSVTPLAPQGNPLAQRPQPVSLSSAAGEEEPSGVPPGAGAAPPPVEAPPSE